MDVSAEKEMATVVAAVQDHMGMVIRGAVEETVPLTKLAPTEMITPLR